MKHKYNISLKLCLFLVTTNISVRGMEETFEIPNNSQDFNLLNKHTKIEERDGIFSKIQSFFVNQKKNVISKVTYFLNRKKIEINEKNLKKSSTKYKENLYSIKDGLISINEEQLELKLHPILMDIFLNEAIFVYLNANDYGLSSESKQQLMNYIDDVFNKKENALNNLYTNLNSILMYVYNNEKTDEAVKPLLAKIIFFNSLIDVNNPDLHTIYILFNSIPQEEINITAYIESTITAFKAFTQLKKEPELSGVDNGDINGNENGNEIEEQIFHLKKRPLNITDSIVQAKIQEEEAEEENKFTHRELCEAILVLRKYLNEEHAEEIGDVSTDNGLGVNTVTKLYGWYNQIFLQENPLSDEQKKAFFAEGKLDELAKPESEEAEGEDVKIERIKKNVNDLCELIKVIVETIHNDYLCMKYLISFHESFAKIDNTIRAAVEEDSTLTLNLEFDLFVNYINRMGFCPEILQKAGYKDILEDPLKKLMVMPELYKLYQEWHNEIGHDDFEESVNGLCNVTFDVYNNENFNEKTLNNDDLYYLSIFFKNPEDYMYKINKYIFVKEIENKYLTEQSSKFTEEKNMAEKLRRHSSSENLTKNPNVTKQNQIQLNKIEAIIEKNTKIIQKNTGTIEKIQVLMKNIEIENNFDDEKNYTQVISFITNNQAMIENEHAKQMLLNKMNDRNDNQLYKTIIDTFFNSNNISNMPSLRQLVMIVVMIIIIPVIVISVLIYLNQDIILKMIMHSLRNVFQKEFNSESSRDIPSQTITNTITPTPIIHEIDYTIYMQIITGVFVIAVAALITYMVIQYQHQSVSENIVNHSNTTPVSKSIISNRKNLLLKLVVGVSILAGGAYYIFKE